MPRRRPPGAKWGGHVARTIAAKRDRLVTADLCRDRLKKVRRDQPVSYDETLMDLIPRATPKFERPEPLAPLVHMIERTATERVFGIGATPPQHGKSFCVQHGLAWLTMKTPGKSHAYATYSQDRARSVSTKTERIFDRLGIRREGTLDQWYLPDYETTIFWTSVGGKLTGEGIDGVLIVDDPYKDRAQACSPVYQQKSMDWYEDVADTRLNPGSSMIVIMARWDANDMSGQLLKRPNPIGDGDLWEECNLKAIFEGDGPVGDNREIGEPLWADRKPLKELLQKQSSSKYSFASLYQGSPRPRGGALFDEPMYYDELPTRGYRVGLGADLAYSKKTSADWSCLAEVWRDGDDYYVVDIERAQVKAPEFVLVLRRKANKYPGHNIDWYASGTETGSGDFIREKNVPLHIINPPGDKYSRALPTSEKWNNRTGEGPRLMVPSPEYAERHRLDWVDDFVYEVTHFTGVKDKNDDQVDGVVSACDQLDMDDDLTVEGSRSNRR